MPTFFIGTIKSFRMLLLRPLSFFFLISLFSLPAFSQKISVTGKLTGEVAKMVKEVQFVCDGKMQRLTVNKEDLTFSGEIKMLEPQFVEINSGNPKPQAYYMVPNEKLTLSIDKPSLQESIVTFGSNKGTRLQGIFNLYYKALEEKGINMKAREWQQLLFGNNGPLVHAEASLNRELTKQAQFIATVPNFRKDMQLFMKSFRNYTAIDQMTMPELETALEEVKKANLKTIAYTIPFVKEYLTDLTNAYAARTLQKYGVSYDASKQRHFSQFIAAETISKYITNRTIRSYLFSEKLKIELPVNGLKNEVYVNYLYENSDQFVKDFYQEKIDQLRENKAPDLNAARKKAFDFLLHDSTGKEYRLADFKGKMIFVDFWASWCAPCKAQIPYQKELEKHYAGKDIVFLGVSLDRSKEAWLKAVKEEDLHGYILHAEGDFKNAFPKAYGIEAIPRYMLIDAEGNMISDNMMKPQNKKEIMGIIDAELYSKNTVEILEKHFKATGAALFESQGIEIRYRQTVMTFNVANKLWYRYPKQLKLISKMEEAEQMRQIVGKSYFMETTTIVNGDSVNTNNPSGMSMREAWVSKLSGFELYLHKMVNNVSVKFAEDSHTTGDSSFVFQLVYNEKKEKYFINKKTYLIDKVIVLTNNQSPRAGGGFFESTVTYDDYRNVNGMMIPFKINLSNISTIKVEHAEVKPLDADFFKL
ncbi:MAG TPA: TlpA disulfide reductase family protein [Lacibacter sp.]|nr:TlpA disulfide reductase family protein [Lacibacter sp.]HMO87845.1 TlpA disulfide reductase family protein [Lacibacter sp.]